MKNAGAWVDGDECGLARGRPANFRIQATAASLGLAFIEGAASPAAPDPERSPHRRRGPRVAAADIRAAAGGEVSQ